VNYLYLVSLYVNEPEENNHNSQRKIYKTTWRSSNSEK